MAPVTLVECHVTKRHHGLGIPRNRINDENDLVRKIDAATIENKIDFFRFIGLQMSTTHDFNRNIIENNEKMRDTNETNETSNDVDLQVENFSSRTKSKRHNNEPENNLVDSMIESRNAAKLIRECRVLIIGEKCRLCGKNFKCIKDLQLHARRKHRRKKSRARVVLKIGDEVISSVEIKKKHLKRAHRDKNYEKDDGKMFNAIDNTDRTLWVSEEIPSNERVPPLIDLEDFCDIKENGSSLRRIADGDVILSPLGGDSSTVDNDDVYGFCRNRDCRDNEDEDIREVLRITRPQKSLSTINHETPNRFERELLLSDAIREFDRLENDGIDVIKFVGSGDNREIDNDIIEEYCWLSDQHTTNRHLDVVENNCSFHIQNDYDIDFTLDGADTLARSLDAKYFDDESASINSKEYRKENGDVVPDFIDYAHSLDYSNPLLDNSKNNNNNNENMYELQRPFYHEARISNWNKLPDVEKSIGHNVCQLVQRNMDPSVLIKEEIMLEDLL